MFTEQEVAAQPAVENVRNALQILSALPVFGGGMPRDIMDGLMNAQSLLKAALTKYEAAESYFRTLGAPAVLCKRCRKPFSHASHQAVGHKFVPEDGA